MGGMSSRRRSRSRSSSRCSSRSRRRRRSRILLYFYTDFGVSTNWLKKFTEKLTNWIKTN